MYVCVVAIQNVLVIYVPCYVLTILQNRLNKQIWNAAKSRKTRNLQK